MQSFVYPDNGVTVTKTEMATRGFVVPARNELLQGWRVLCHMVCTL